MKFIASIYDLPIKKLINRMVNITSGILRDSLEILKEDNINSFDIEDITLRDDDIDRMYLLVYRLVNKGVINQKILPI